MPSIFQKRKQLVNQQVYILTNCEHILEQASYKSFILHPEPKVQKKTKNNEEENDEVGRRLNSSKLDADYSAAYFIFILPILFYLQKCKTFYVAIF